MVLLVVVLLSVAALALLLGEVRKRRIAALEREGLARFEAFFSDRGLSPKLVRNVYHYLAENAATGTQHFDVNPTDELAKRYGLVTDLDVQDAVIVIADRSGLPLPKAHTLDEANPLVHTVDDLLRFLAPMAAKAA
ncbi:MAG: hypothetical protein MUF00_12870 [Gemmatimonadaceae bacterium]|jgi:hypothetical protein|nr:hypothetical protein [Gemmatimonadaceae bacterium]